MNQHLLSVVKNLPSAAADDLMLQVAASEMKARMDEQRSAGLSGWHGDNCTAAALKRLLLKNAAEGDMVDVMNLAGMIHVRQRVFGESLVQSPAGPLGRSCIDVRQPAKMVTVSGAGGNAVLLPQYGLMFSAEPPPMASSHEDAIRIASETSLHGHSDWRLPEATELSLLIDRSRHKPAIDPEYFPHTPTDDWYWTATPLTSDPAYAWLVDFSDGDVNGYHRDGSGFVRAVRSVPPSQ